MTDNQFTLINKSVFKSADRFLTINFYQQAKKKNKQVYILDPFYLHTNQLNLISGTIDKATHYLITLYHKLNLNSDKNITQANENLLTNLVTVAKSVKKHPTLLDLTNLADYNTNGSELTWAFAEIANNKANGRNVRNTPIMSDSVFNNSDKIIRYFRKYAKNSISTTYTDTKLVRKFLHTLTDDPQFATVFNSARTDINEKRKVDTSASVINSDELKKLDKFTLIICTSDLNSVQKKIMNAVIEIIKSDLKSDKNDENKANLAITDVEYSNRQHYHDYLIKIIFAGLNSDKDELNKIGKIFANSVLNSDTRLTPAEMRAKDKNAELNSGKKKVKKMFGYVIK